MNLTDIRTLLIDGDGVLWTQNQPMPGLNRFFGALAARGIQWALLTNNATKSQADYVAKLQGFSVQARPDQIVGSANVTALTLRRRFPAGTPLYVIGGTGLRNALADAGFTVHNGHDRPEVEIPAVVVGMDTELTYRKLAVATLLIRAGATFIATNPDRTFPTPQGIVPGAGSLIAALVAATDVEPEVIGKPAPALFEAAMEQLGATPGETAMLGDRMETDILGAQRLGLGTILVLTGVTRREDLPAFDYQPDMVCHSIAEIADALEHVRL
jgi:4-nitrophenyl phosphatase